MAKALAIAAQWLCVIVGFCLGGAETKVGGAWILASFFFTGAILGSVIRERKGGSR